MSNDITDLDREEIFNILDFCYSYKVSTADYCALRERCSTKQNCDQCIKMLYKKGFSLSNFIEVIKTMDKLKKRDAKH